MKSSSRLATLLSTTLLAACGGGGGGGGGTTETPTPNGPLAAYAGVFQTRSSGVYSEMLVHPQGQVVGYSGQDAPASGTGTQQQENFSGTFAVSGTKAQKAGADFVTIATPFSSSVAQPSTTTHGTADVALSLPDAAGAMTATITNASTPAPLPTITATRVPVSEAFLGLPFAKLGGDYTYSEAIPPLVQKAHVDAATGTVTGDYALDCQITGTVSGYDNAVAMFLLQATFSGSGCAAQNVPTGSGQFVGYLASSRLGNLILVATGTVAGQRTYVFLGHSQKLGTY